MRRSSCQPEGQEKRNVVPVQSFCCPLKVETDGTYLHIPTSQTIVLPIPTSAKWPSRKSNMETCRKIPDGSAARLCSKCSVLEFDDSKFGVEGYVGYAREEDQEMLTFDDDVQRIPRSFHHCAMEVKLDYQHDDVLPELEGLRQSAEAGCDFCHYLRESIRRSDLKGKLTRKVKIQLCFYWRSRFARWYGLNALVAHLHIQWDESGKKDFYEDDIIEDDEGHIWHRSNFFVFKVESGYGNCQSWLQLEPAPRSEVLCAEQVESIQSLLDTCSHQCNHLQDARVTPTRLLDLDAPDAKDGIRLIETWFLNPSEELKYAALSYCWGSEQDAAGQTTTTTDNLQARFTDIHFSSISRVMQDAVVATRRLKIRYLWIDAVCIIQDSLQDWERESEKMGLIYNNAFVTIGALASSSCHQGFLDRPNSLPISFCSSIKPSIQGTYRLRYRSCMHSLYLLAGRDFDVRDSPWSTRAWTLQEEKLSTRFLRFGASRLSLICAKRESVEPFDKLLLNLEPEAILDSSQRLSIYEIWMDLIMISYSGRHISDIEDIFPAVSGLAKRVATATGGVYVAGFWKDYLPRGLELFSQSPDQKSLEERLAELAAPQTYVCPSWSWATASGVIRFPGECGELRSECEIISAWSELVSELNPFGRIKDAELQIRGRVVELPSDLHRNHQTLFGIQEWKTNMSEHHTATCWLDWESSFDIEPLQGKALMLLLLSGEELVESSRRDSSHDDSISESTSSGYMVCGADMYVEEDLQTRDLERMTLDEEKPIYEEEAGGHGEDDDTETERIQSSAASDLKDEGNRVALGLLLHPAKRESKYFRVGAFRCTTDQGGLEAFRNYEYREVHLI